MDRNELIFNTYKTAKQKGSQKIKIPNELKSILTKYIKLNNGRSDYLLFNYKFKKLPSANLTLRLNAIFGGKKISVNILRHVYMCDKYADNLAEMKQDFSDMGRSIKQSNVYIKKND